MGRPFLAIIIPAFNEEERLGPTLEAMTSYLARQDYTWSIWVVSDGSADKTVQVALDAAERHPEISCIDSKPNKGKGFAVRLGMMTCDADWLLISDADLATPIEELEKLLPETSKGFDVVIGSRPLRESQLEVRQPLWREMGGRAFNLFIQSVGVWGIKDTQCGFKLFSNAAAKDIFSRCKITGFGFDVESLMVAKDLGYKISEVGVRWRHIDGSKFDPVKEAPRMLKELFQLRLKGKRNRISPNGESK